MFIYVSCFCFLVCACYLSVVSASAVTSTDSSRDQAINRLMLRHSLRHQFVLSFLLFGGMTVVWLLSGRGYFWPAWIAFGLSFSLLSKLFKIYYQPPVITEEAIARELRRR